MSGHLLSRARRDREPWGIWLFARWLGRTIVSPVTGFNRWRRLLRLRHGGIDHSWWWFDRLSFRLLKWLTYLLAALFMAWLVRALIVVIDRSADATLLLGFNPNKICVDRAVECGALTGWVTSLLSIALASAVFLLWRLGLMRRRYLRYARKQPKELVPTAGTIIGRVVGRDQLCRVVMEDLRVRRSRRPHVLVGGVGTGKTAVLVQLTELLAKRHAVPVPIRLRDATELDFTKLAKDKFLKELDPKLSSAAEGEKAWRRLLRDGRIVVLADGLEEALADEDESKGKKPTDRDTKIRTAIAEAHKRCLPLFIASRPHAPLRGMDATVHELEPLSEVDALSYITESRPSEDDWRLSWIVEMAGVAEAPLYLQITRELSEQDLLDDIVRREEQVLHSYTHDQSTLRLRLLETWEKALIDGRLYPQVALNRAERAVTLDWISALACRGLKNDRLVVSLDEQLPQSILDWIARDRPEAVVKPGRRGLTGIDVRLAATWGAQLGLVEVIGDRVRFEHSLIEAYLGSRAMTWMVTDREYWDEALGQTPDARDPDHPRPGREILIALVLYSRRGIGRGSNDWRPAVADRQVPHVKWEEVCQRLMDAGRMHDDNKALDIYAAALEIASAPDQSAPAHEEAEPAFAATEVALRRHPVLGATEIDVVTAVFPPAQDSGGCGIRSLSGMGAEIGKRWDAIHSTDLETLEEAKIGLVCRFGDALRTLSDSARGDVGHLGYLQLYEICCVEESYRVRLAGAQEIGRGGCAAYEELRERLDLAHIGARPAGPDGQRRPATASRTPGTGQWAWQVSAWLLPLLVGSRQEECREQSHHHDQRARLEDWLSHLRPAGHGRSADPGWPAMSPELARADIHQPGWLSISEEIALAQGFKYAANVRHRQLHNRPEAWSYLEGKALEMLRDASYWFSELTLIQALTLWAMPESSQPTPEQRRRRHDSARSIPSANPDQTVERWLDIVAGKAGDGRHRSSRRVHPFVEAAADMANRALAVRRPGRFLWMDESDVVSRIGAGLPKLTPSAARRPRLWIPPSMGWSALDAEAQQLLADVLLLLNLTERGETADDAEGLLRRASGHELPPCITEDRRPLRPLLTVGRAGVDRRGDGCLDGCSFQLCPYPPRGLQHHRSELSEEFCRRQYQLVRRYLQPLHLRRRTARWQGMTASRLRVFWMQMAERARNSSPA